MRRVCPHCDELLAGGDELADHVSDAHPEAVNRAFMGLGVRQ